MVSDFSSQENRTGTSTEDRAMGSKVANGVNQFDVAELLNQGGRFSTWNNQAVTAFEL